MAEREDERRQREELRTSTREREDGGVHVRERVAVPKKRQEVNVERVPVEEDVPSEPEIEDDEI